MAAVLAGAQMPGALEAAVGASAFICAALSSHAGLQVLARKRRIKRTRTKLDLEVGTGMSRRAREPLSISLARKATQRQRQSASSKHSLPFSSVRSRDKMAMRIARAGLEGEVTPEGLAEGRSLLALVLAALFALAGGLLAPGLVLPAALAGGLAGWLAASRALKDLAVQRSRQLESHLSEAVEVICLGLRGGMPFDRALGLYCACFDSLLARELRTAAGIWQAGILSREQALRNLAGSYDSAVFARVVDSIVRSMRFGTPLADSLEVLAGEARASHRARVNEQVMKAPVKMMLPIGALILPSMMLLVLGPVLLQLLDGF